jgi:non-specific serine/threonine protein kinase
MLQTTQRSKLLDYIRTRAPYSVVDEGLQRAGSGDVGECSKTGNAIKGVVRASAELMHSVGVEFDANQDAEATCSCSSTEDMREQWCSHAVALLWHAFDLGFLDPHNGFAAPEAVHRTSTGSPNEVAEVIRSVSQKEHQTNATVAFSPTVSIILDLSSDRLGVQVCFDGEPQSPILFESFTKVSSRALDTLLVKILDDEGSWDEEHKFWYINASSAIEMVLGLIPEYKQVTNAATKRNIEFATEPLDARLNLAWSDNGLDLSMEWILSDGSTELKHSELIGTGPYWTLVRNALYRVTPHASRIATLFAQNAVLSYPRSRIAPILEELRQGLFDPKFIRVLNPELQPESEIVTPKPVLELAKREFHLDPYSPLATTYQNEFTLAGTLEFEYPSPKASENLVYLPNRSYERDCIDLLKSLGFNPAGESRSVSVSGDHALDLVHQSKSALPAEWKVLGLEQVRKALKFSELNISVSIQASRDEELRSKSSSKVDWFDCQVSLTQNNANVPLSTLFKNAKGGSDRWIRLDSGAYAKVPGGGIQQLRTTLGILDSNFRLSNTIKTRMSAAQAVSFSGLSEEQFSISIDSRIKELHQKLREFQSIPNQKPHKNFCGKLRSYQSEGLSWLHFLNDFGLGGILADEMGLGKTVQTLAFLQNICLPKKGKSKTSGKPALIVAPTSVITNWFYEIKRFVPEMSVLLLHGPGRKAHFGDIPKHDLIITSYALLRLDRFELEKHEFSYVILDEAQNIKNPETATTRAAKSLKAKGRLALSGTPTENRPLELWSIMDFLMPGYLGSVDYFRTYIEKPILEGGPGVQIARFLNSKTKPFILRRTKAEVEKDLPPKIESEQYVSMAPSQAALYNEILEEVRPRVFEAVNKVGVRGASVSILAALLRLRQVCNHPNSIEALREVTGYESGKFNLLRELIREALDSGRKILLFSQFREMLAIIRRFLEEEKVSHLYLDGATRNRQELIDRFNGDSDVRLFLVSLKAGGTGLNLTAADTVVIYDPWWNPAVENQAVDRAHRIGQTKTVHVYRLITENSIEQKIMQLKAKKAKLVEALINENGLSTLSLSKDDLENLFSPLPLDGLSAEDREA